MDTWSHANVEEAKQVEDYYDSKVKAQKQVLWTAVVVDIWEPYCVLSVLYTTVFVLFKHMYFLCWF